ncbi:tripartite-type tricarboxylate transporter receptor subunit TctC [Arthrobacter pigmenti]|uniref:Tripartite-type tricarboxylate transporter receptor subunit TctC n=1 Tax=Arthrobacter pigmenti TaxID=271432 RepID=A0A846RQ61_9MICC|nr:tripartite tricarboxylate transporter substrate binding protein [Arthrobacter pigmenti]NJC23700.1 tripartite-type tricarboxylate transporter receptor subunit TctC [Arthrobacter pigmenti]
MRKSITSVSGAALLLLAVSACGDAAGQQSTGEVSENYPEENLTMVVGYGPGGSTDVGARLMADALEDELGVSITVENREGAGGQVGLTAVANAPCDGYTFGTANFPSAIVSVLDESRGATYDRESFAPIALQVVDPTAIVVAPDSPYETIDDLIAAAEENPGELLYTTTGVASNEHFAMVAVQEASGAEFSPVHFPDGGGAPKTAFLGGETEIYVANVSDVVEMTENGQGKVLGIMDEERSPFLPDVPTFTESGYDVEISSSRGYTFPSCVPEQAVTTISDAMGTIMENEEFLTPMQELGLAPSYRDAEAYAEYWTETQNTFEELFPLVREEG